MNSYSISRRVDELGRIVIPIEIRKDLNIKVGDNFEFSIINENIVLKKKKMSKDLYNILKEIDSSISSIISGNYVITNREKILFSSDSSLINKHIDDDIILLFNNNQEYFVVKNSKNFIDKTLYVFQLYLENNLCGSIFIYDIDDINKYIKLIKFINTYINKTVSISQ